MINFYKNIEERIISVWRRFLNLKLCLTLTFSCSVGCIIGTKTLRHTVTSVLYLMFSNILREYHGSNIYLWIHKYLSNQIILCTSNLNLTYDFILSWVIFRCLGTFLLISLALFLLNKTVHKFQWRTSIRIMKLEKEALKPNSTCENFAYLWNIGLKYTSLSWKCNITSRRKCRL